MFVEYSETLFSLLKILFVPVFGILINFCLSVVKIALTNHCRFIITTIIIISKIYSAHIFLFLIIFFVSFVLLFFLFVEKINESVATFLIMVFRFAKITIFQFIPEVFVILKAAFLTMALLLALLAIMGNFLKTCRFDSDYFLSLIYFSSKRCTKRFKFISLSHLIFQTYKAVIS